MDSNFNRRELLKFLSAAALTAPLALPAAGTGEPLYFTKSEFALLDALSEMMIPADDHSPGAHAAGVAPYIDRFVSEAFLASDKTSWRKGLAAVDALSQALHNKAFLDAGKEGQIAVLKKMCANEGKPHEDENQKSEAERFWGQLKNTVVFAYYTTNIGIHQEINYKGNVLLEQFAGYMPDAPLPPISSLANA